MLVLKDTVKFVHFRISNKSLPFKLLKIKYNLSIDRSIAT